MLNNQESRDAKMQKTWDESFQDQIKNSAYNTAPVEALVRTVSHHLRSHHTEDYTGLEYLEVGCGAAPNLIWLAEKDITAHGLDISPTALELAEKNFVSRNLKDKLGRLEHGSATELPFESASLDGVLESCVFQHLTKEDRIQAFSEVARVLKPGGIFVGHMLNLKHTTFQHAKGNEVEGDPGTVMLNNEGNSTKITLESIGLAHFFSKTEFQDLLKPCSVIDPCELTYELPQNEAKSRGYEYYQQAMWVVYAVK